MQQCASNSQCSKYFYCTREYQCAPKLPETARCSSGMECLSGSCSRPFVILPIGQCIPNPAVDNDPTGRLCRQSEDCNARSHQEKFHYCADFESIPTTASGLGLPIAAGSDGSTIGVCLRLALLGDRCDESAQCLSGYCRSEGGSSVAGPSIGVCDFPPAPVVGDLSAAFSGRGGKHSLVLLGGALAVVLLLLTVVYGALMMAKLVRQKKRQSSRSTAATGAVDVYVPMRIVSYSTAAGRPDSAGISEGEEEEGEEDFETSQPSGCPPPYKLVSENETDEDYSSDDDKHTTVVAGSSSGSGNNNTSGDDTANLATLDRKIQLN